MPVLRILENVFPNCSQYDQSATFSKVSRWNESLIEEAEPLASRDAART